MSRVFEAGILGGTAVCWGLLFLGEKWPAAGGFAALSALAIYNYAQEQSETDACATPGADR